MYFVLENTTKYCLAYVIIHRYMSSLRVPLHYIIFINLYQ